MQLRYETGLTGQDHVSQQAWGQASLPQGAAAESTVERTDRGKPRRLPDAAAEALIAIKKQHPAVKQRRGLGRDSVTNPLLVEVRPQVLQHSDGIGLQSRENHFIEPCQAHEPSTIVATTDVARKR